jgi:hypothetical protein
MTEIIMRRRGSALVPVTEIDAEAIASIPEGKDVFVTPKHRRNPKHHRLAWALAEKLSEMCDFNDREDAMDFLKIKARHIKMIMDPRSGHVEIVPKSISFASLDQQAFSRIFNRMVWVICNEIVPGLEETALRREVEAMVSPQQSQVAA